MFAYFKAYRSIDIMNLNIAYLVFEFIVADTQSTRKS